MEKSAQGDIEFEEREDILTVALGTKKCPGRIRTVPRGVGFKKFFGKKSHSTSTSKVTHEDIQELEQKLTADFQDRLEKALRQQRIELLREMELQLRRDLAEKSTKETFSKEVLK